MSDFKCREIEKNLDIIIYSQCISGITFTKYGQSQIILKSLGTRKLKCLNLSHKSAKVTCSQKEGNFNFNNNYMI